MARAPIIDYDKKKIPQAIQMLEDGETKKAICDFLGIKYNVTRLQKIIDEFIEEKERDTTMRAKRRGTPISDNEKVSMIEAYLINDDPISAIASRFYRSEQLVKLTLERAGVLIKCSADPLNPALIPEECIKETFNLGEIVWVPGYGCIGEIKKDYGNGGYRIYLLDPTQHRNVNYMWWDIGSLRHIQALGVNISQMSGVMGTTEIRELLGEALRKAKQQKREE